MLQCLRFNGLAMILCTGMSEASSVQLGKWCQSVDRTETQHSTQQYVTIVFHTNEDVSGDGFRLSYWRDAKAIEGMQ